VLVDNGGPYVVDLRAAGESVDDQGVQGVGVCDGHMNEEVFGAGDAEDRQDVGQPFEEAADRRHLGARWPTDPDGDECLDWAAEGSQVHVGVVAVQDSSGSEATDPLQRGRRCEARSGGQLTVAQPRISLQCPEERRIKFVEHPAPALLAEQCSGLLSALLHVDHAHAHVAPV